MREMPLDKYGFLGSVLREDGVLVRYDGKIVRPYDSGQIRIPRGKHLGGELKNMPYFMAEVFQIPKPHGSRWIHFLDGDRTNYHIDNLRWSNIVQKLVKKKKDYSALRPAMISRHINGDSVYQIGRALHVPAKDVLAILIDFEESLKNAP